MTFGRWYERKQRGYLIETLVFSQISRKSDHRYFVGCIIMPFIFDLTGANPRSHRNDKIPFTTIKIKLIIMWPLP